MSSRVRVPVMCAPGIVSCIRLIVRRKVDFPQPEGPISAMTLLGSMLIEISLSAWKDPKNADTLSASMRFAMEGIVSLRVLDCSASGDEASNEAQEHHDQNQRKRRGPGAVSEV